MIELNRTYNENCLDTMSRMPDGFVDLTLADYPYGVEIDYSDYTDTKENLVALIKSTMPEILRVSKLSYITCGVQNVFLFPQSDWIMSWYYGTTNTYGRNGFNSWQPILVYGKDPYLANGLGCRMDVIVDSKPPEKSNHPCPKPLTIWKKIISRGSVKQSDIIYDPFMGSGTTAIASHLLKRQWIGSEISSEYCEIANKRLKPYLNQEVMQFQEAI